jgi:hypothetical protein
MAGRRARIRGAAAALALTGCTALIDVKDIFFDPDAPLPGADGGGADAISEDGAQPDGGGDGDGCVADLLTDPSHCGRCNHDCLGGTCEAGRCQAIQIATVPNAPLRFVHLSDDHVFVSPRVTLATHASGIWRIPKAGGTPEPYVTTRYAEAMATLGDTLYFIVNDKAEDGADAHGGLWSCSLTAAPCTPTLVAAANNPRAVTVDRGAVYYPDLADGRGIMRYAPPGPPTLFREGFGAAGNLEVDDQDAFYTVSFFSSPPRSTLFHILPDAGFTELTRFESPNASAGELHAASDALFVALWEFTSTSAGVVRRVPRGGGILPCDYGADKNLRPYGVHVDDERIYWTNQGEGPAPYSGGSVVACPRQGCCTDPETLWTGGSAPGAMSGDARAVYWASQPTGAVWKVAKP